MASAGDVNGDGYADLVVGADGRRVYRGSAYVYLGSAVGLPIRPSLSLTSPLTEADPFGYSVASAGDVNGDGYADLVVGATAGAGRAYVYLGSAVGLPISPSLSLSGDLDYFGYSVANAGDINGDGYADLVVGAPRNGPAHIYLGSAMGLPARSSLSLTSPDGAYSDFGTCVASAGDVNRDGYADLVVGAPYALNRSGRAHVYFGAPTGLPSSPGISLSGPDPFGDFGTSIASTGDVNRDGYADLIVGAYGSTGRAHVYLGIATGLPLSPSVSLDFPDGRGGLFGYSVASADDLATTRPAWGLSRVWTWTGATARRRM